MEITFEREALYEQVWATPLTQLAKKFGLSDNGLRKVCKALTIPLPRAGHWAKVAAGHQVRRAPLPSGAERTTFVSHTTQEEKRFEASEDETWLSERIAFEENEANRITVQAKPGRWHRVIEEVRAELREAVREMAVAKRDSERAEKRPHVRQEPSWEGWRWGRFFARGQILLDTHKAAAIRVSPGTYERALAILNTLCREAERRSFSVALNEKCGRIQFQGYGATIDLRITEYLDRKWRTEKNEWDNKIREVEYKEPTVKLRLFVGEPWSEVVTADTKTTPLETKLNEAFVRISRQVVRQREKERENEAREREWKAEEARREAAVAQRHAEEARKERERQRCRSLLIEAKQWKAAALIREYVAHVSSNGLESRPGLASWAAWASKVAEHLDPTAERNDLLRSVDAVAHPLDRNRFRDLQKQ